MYVHICWKWPKEQSILLQWIFRRTRFGEPINIKVKYILMQNYDFACIQGEKGRSFKCLRNIVKIWMQMRRNHSRVWRLQPKYRCQAPSPADSCPGQKRWSRRWATSLGSQACPWQGQCRNHSRLGLRTPKTCASTDELNSPSVTWT